MVRTVGIDAGDYSIKAVELEGNYKKVRLLACSSERLADDPAGEEARATALAELAGGMLNGAKMIGEVVLGQACREAVLRTIDVPFKGAAESLTALISGETDLQFASLSSAIPLIKSGRLRALGMTSPRRSPSMTVVRSCRRWCCSPRACSRGRRTSRRRSCSLTGRWSLHLVRR